MEKTLSVLFVGKKDDPHANRALSFCRANCASVEVHLGRHGQDRVPEDLGWWTGDYIFSYLSPWIIPDSALKRAKRGALNFHPAPPEYPGIGCTNFALYDNAPYYGAMCHHMDAAVDTGRIIAVKRFRMFPTDTVESATNRTHDHLLSLFYDIMEIVLMNGELPTSTEVWTRKPYTRKELNKLAEIDPAMSEEEIARRVRATTYGPWKPTVDLHGFVFELESTSNRESDPMSVSSIAHSRKA